MAFVNEQFNGQWRTIPPEFQALLAQFADTRTVKDPLIIDLNGDGFSRPVNQSVYFDLDGDGNLAEATTSWVGAGDGLIVVDLNNNNRVDDGSEIFSALGANAWEQLRAYDSNHDNKITSADAQWTKIHIWQDKNSDGYTQADEWFDLSDLNITGINIPASGNAGSVTTPTGTILTNAVTFDTDDRNTVYSGDAEMDFKTLFLPQLRGFSEVLDLRVAMSIDNTGATAIRTPTNDNLMFLEKKIA